MLMIMIMMVIMMLFLWLGLITVLSLCIWRMNISTTQVLTSYNNSISVTLFKAKHIILFLRDSKEQLWHLPWVPLCRKETLNCPQPTPNGKPSVLGKCTPRFLNTVVLNCTNQFRFCIAFIITVARVEKKCLKYMKDNVRQWIKKGLTESWTILLLWSVKACSLVSCDLVFGCCENHKETF